MVRPRIASRRQYAELLLELLAGRRSIDELVAHRAEDPFLEGQLTSYDTLEDGPNRARKYRYADHLSIDQRDEFLRMLAWCLSDAPAPARRTVLGAIWDTLARRPPREDPEAWPFVDHGALRDARERHGKELEELLMRAGLSDLLDDPVRRPCVHSR